MQNYIDRIKNVFTNPTEFFKSVDKEKDIKTPLLTFGLFNVFSVFLTALLVLYLFAISEVSAFVYVVTIMSFIMSAAFGFVTPFIGAAIIFLGLLIVGVRKIDFVKVFKVVAYAGTITIMYSIVSLLIQIPFYLTFPDMLVSQYNAMDIESDAAQFDSFIQIFDSSEVTSAEVLFNLSMILVFIISFIHALIIEVKGISLYNQISKLRAFFGIMMIPLILIGIAIILLVLFLSVHYVFMIFRTYWQRPTRWNNFTIFVLQ